MNKIDRAAQRPAEAWVHQDRNRSRHFSAWARSFACDDLRPLIVCRGPIRKEALDVFYEMGIEAVGILLSEKDSIVYPNALAPELRAVRPEHVHRVPDYTGASKEERVQRMRDIVRIAKENDYNAIYAGYGFMAEDAEFVKTIEDAGLVFMGPGSRTQYAAGQKDEAKRTALSVDVSTTPGVDDVTTRTVVAKYPTRGALQQVVEEKKLSVDPAVLRDESQPIAVAAQTVLAAALDQGMDLFTIDELGQQVRSEVLALFDEHTGRRIRLKAVGSGGGKGQRILPEPETDDEAGRKKVADMAPDLVREVLGEVKATAEGDQKNLLLEVNIETTRHHEIQLLGNGQWCISLGGRDCSVQMHEQKLLEISITQEGLKHEVIQARERGRDAEAQALTKDLATLERMEAQAERFGEAVGLDSASTFECIVDRDRHYFMEMNTRIQVEHRVSELCYGLRFTNPDDPADHFDVESLVEAMALVAWHGDRLPKPVRYVREAASVEARLNATDSSLSPHAGGEIIRWSDPHPYEVRDDQGISVKNPDTKRFMRYRLAGAYDSNIALLVTAAGSRYDSFERLSEILRVMKLRGDDLSTNLDFHYGLVNWFLAQNPYGQVTTAFLKPYLSQVGLLQEAANDIDVTFMLAEVMRRHRDRATNDEQRAAVDQVVREKETLLQKAFEALLSKPHLLAGWISRYHDWVRHEDGRVVWRKNPLELVRETYHFMNMDYRADLPAAHCIWEHDDKLLSRGLEFYERLYEVLGMRDWAEVEAQMASADAPDGFDADRWPALRAAHVGWQMGPEAFGTLFALASRVGFWELRVEPDLSVTIPDRLRDPELFERMRRVLSPPPATRADEIVAVSGGMFYAREAPDRPPLVRKGDHFEKGQPLYVIEVMKMFNKVGAPFSGTVDEILVENADGTVVHKGQPLFKVTPDERVVVEDPAVRKARRQERTTALLDAVAPAAG